MSQKILEVKDLTKRFGRHTALDQVSFQVEQGEILGLIGANGSGKSTLMNILFGNRVIRDTGGYEGELYFDGTLSQITSTKKAMEMGMGMIHQEFMLIPEMTIEENITMQKEKTFLFAGRKNSQFGYLDKKKNHEIAHQALQEFELQIDSHTLAKNISVNTMQFVEIAREITKENLKLLILDEPTAVLNYGDAKKLLEILRELANKGVTVIFCSHRLHEIRELCDHVIVLRDGRKVADMKKNEIEIDRMAQAMIGHEVKQIQKSARDLDREEILRFEEYSVQMPGDELQGIDLSVKRGEILGISSLSGGGKFALGYGIMGLFPVEGKIYFKGDPLSTQDGRDTIQKGVFLLPDDRKNLGLLLDENICENVTFTGFHGRGLFQKKIGGLLTVKDQKKAEAYSNEIARRLQIKCTSVFQKVNELSGGNQQKVCIARAIALDPQVLFVCEPTRGVDIEAKERILEILTQVNQEKGTTIVIITSELTELVRICDRIAILCEGRLSEILPPTATEEEFGLAYAGEGKKYAG